MVLGCFGRKKVLKYTVQQTQTESETCEECTQTDPDTETAEKIKDLECALEAAKKQYADSQGSLQRIHKNMSQEIESLKVEGYEKDRQLKDEGAMLYRCKSDLAMEKLRVEVLTEIYNKAKAKFTHEREKLRSAEEKLATVQEEHNNALNKLKEDHKKQLGECEFKILELRHAEYRAQEDEKQWEQDVFCTKGAYKVLEARHKEQTKLYRDAIEELASTKKELDEQNRAFKNLECKSRQQEAANERLRESYQSMLADSTSKERALLAQSAGESGRMLKLLLKKEIEITDLKSTCGPACRPAWVN